MLRKQLEVKEAVEDKIIKHSQAKGLHGRLKAKIPDKKPHYSKGVQQRKMTRQLEAMKLRLYGKEKSAPRKQPKHKGEM